MKATPDRSPGQMWAVYAGEHADSPLSWRLSPRPTIGPGQVLVRVCATALNRADLLQRRGLYPPPPGASEALGLEMAGVVEAVGAAVTEWSPGDRVCALLEGGGYAEYAQVDAGMLLPVPAGLSLVEAAAIPEALYTAFLNLVVEARMKPGERVLVHAGASGVGTLAIQLCRALGNPVFATTSASKVEFVVEQGATRVWDRHEPEFLSSLEASLEAVDIILDPVGGSYLQTNLRLLRKQGRLVLIGVLGGVEGSLDLRQVLLRRLRLIGSTLRARGREEKVSLTKRLREEVWPLYASRQLCPVVSSVVPWREVEAAHQKMAANQTRGKVVLEIVSEVDL